MIAPLTSVTGPCGASQPCTHLAVFGLPARLSKGDFKRMCERYGRVRRVWIITDHACGFAKFATRAEAERAYDAFSRGLFSARFAVGDRWVT